MELKEKKDSKFSEIKERAISKGQKFKPVPAPKPENNEEIESYDRFFNVNKILISKSGIY